MEFGVFFAKIVVFLPCKPIVLSIKKSKKMKKALSILVIALFAMTMASCNKGNETENLIVGKWRQTEVIATETVNGVTADPVSMLDPGETTILTFKKNHTYSSVWYSNEGDLYSYGTWSAEDDTMTMTDDFGSQNYFIETLDKNFMVLTYTESEVQDGDSHTMYIVMKMQRM